jgi:hypothetical protein
MAKGNARDLAKEAAWRRRVARQARSGQTVRGWCRQHGVTEAAFHWWRRELARRDAERSSSARRDAERPCSARRDAERSSSGRFDATRRSSARRNAEAQGFSFVPVHVAHDPERDGEGRIEIELTDGRRLRITGPADRRMLSEMLAVLISTSPMEAESRAC